jgi:hypothetical protein
VRTSPPSATLAQAAAQEFARIDPAVAPPAVASYRDLLARDAVRSQAAMLLFGILGADVLRDVLRGALAQTSAGIIGGVILAAVFGRLLSGLLFEVSPLDPATFTGVVALTIAAVSLTSPRLLFPRRSP